MKHVFKLLLFDKIPIIRIFSMLAFYFLSISWANAQEIKGVVVDQSNVPILGVNVLLKNTARGVITDFDGNFNIDAKKGETLVFSFIGFETKEVIVGSQNVITVTLEEGIAQLDEIVVVGYGKQKKVNLTGSVSQVNAETFENKPVINVAQALQGVIPNLNVNVGTGALNNTPSFNVRGGTSFSGGSFSNGSPLILIDGVEGDINLLNPEDIASVSVLKDAASAAIYGARGAFGVMLVTTKKGSKNQKSKITYSTSSQWNSPSAIPNLLDAYTIQLADMKALELENKSVPSDMIEKLARIKAHRDNPETVPNYYMDAGGNIIWVNDTPVYDLALRKYSPTIKHNLSLTGGSDTNSYYASIGFQDQKGLYNLNTDTFKRYNGLLNVTSKATDWLSIDYGLQYNNSVFSEPVSPAGKGGWWRAMSQESFKNINMPIKTSPDSPVGEMYTDNILSFMDYGSNNKERQEMITLSVAPSVMLTKNWNLKSSFAYKSFNFRRKQVVPELRRIENRWDASTNVHTNPNYVQKWSSHSDQYTFNLYSDVDYKIKKHEIYAMAGFNQEWYTYDSLGGRGEELLTPNIPVIGQTLGNQYAYDSESHWALRGGFYRITYNFDNKYLLESNGRYDGTSRFPKDSRFKFFPSISGAWRVSQENFAEVLKPALNELKFRASYGSLGNQNVANYIYIPSYGTVPEVSHLFGGTRPMGVNPPGLVDPYLTWETATTIDFGVDLTLFHKLDLTVDWYNRTTKDILVAGDKFPAILGTSAPTKNSGSMETIGWDLNLKWRDQLKGGFKYDVAFMLSDYVSKITKFDGNPDNSLSGLYVGKKMGEIWGYETDGIYQNQAEIDAGPDQKIFSSQWYPGDVRYKDLDGNGIIGNGNSTLDKPGDRKIIGNNTPRYQYGLNFNGSFKSFDLNIFFQGVGKRDYWIGDSFLWGKMAGGTGTWDVYNNTWTPERTDAFYPAYKTKSGNTQVQTRYLQDASYLRLKTVALGYSISEDVLEKLNLQKLRFYVSGFNVWENTTIPDLFDPESMSANYPMLRTYALGMQITF